MMEKTLPVLDRVRVPKEPGLKVRVMEIKFLYNLVELSRSGILHSLDDTISEMKVQKRPGGTS